MTLQTIITNELKAVISGDRPNRVIVIATSEGIETYTEPDTFDDVSGAMNWTVEQLLQFADDGTIALTDGSWSALRGALMTFPEYIQLVKYASGEDGGGGNLQASTRLSMLSECLSTFKELTALQGVLTGEDPGDDPTVGSAGLVLSLKNANLWSADLRDRLRAALDDNGFSAIVLPTIG